MSWSTGLLLFLNMAAAGVLAGLALEQAKLKSDECQEVRLKANATNLACLCDYYHCDKHPFEWPSDLGHILRAETSRSGKRFAKSTLPALNLSSSAASPQADAVIELFISKRLYQVLGFGGTLTDTAATLIKKLPSYLRESLIEDYFGSNGTSYNLLRLPIGGTDFSTRAYSLADAPNGTEDFELHHFALAREDLKFKIPILNAALEERRNSKLDDPIRVLAASWSPPKWMKDNNSLVRGHLKPGKQYMDAYARYLIKFLDAYKAEANVSVFLLSAQNEPHWPSIAPFSANSLEFKPPQLRQLLGEHLGPLLTQSSHDKVRLLAWDDNTVGASLYLDELLKSAEVRRYVKAFGLHWYTHGFEQIVPYETLGRIRRRLPASMFMMSTEASWVEPPSVGNWTRGERYARDLLENLSRGSVAWLDWNLAVNLTGGPSWSSPALDAAVLVDIVAGFYVKNPMYYAIMHFSRFVQAGAHVFETRVGKSSDSLFAVGAELEGPTSSLRRLALVVLNTGEHPQVASLVVHGCGTRANGSLLQEVSIEAHSISSFGFAC